MSTLKLGPARNPLERTAMLAHTRRLGIDVAADGTVNLEGAGGLFHGPQGGAGAIRRVAGQDLFKDELSLAELNGLKPNVVAQLFSSSGAKATASAQLAGTTSALESTADQLLAFADRFERNDFADDMAPINAVRRLAARAEKTAADLDGALTEKVLGFATPEQLDDLRSAYLRVTGALAHLADAFPVASAPQFSGLDSILFQVKENYGSDYGAIPFQNMVLDAADALRKGLARVLAHGETFGVKPAAVSVNT
jgi:hypothetical protein